MNNENNDQPRPVDEQPPTQEPVAPPIYRSNLQPVSEKPFSSSPEPVFAPKKSGKKKGLIIGGIIAAVLVILGAGSALAYQFWYQNPDKVVADGVMNAFKAKSITYTGSLTANSSGSKVKLEVDGGSDRAKGNVNVKATFDMEGSSFTLAGSGLIDGSGTLYVKMKNVKQAIEPYRGMLPAEAQTVLDQFVAKIDDRWIKISSDDMKTLSEDYSKAQKCVDDTLKKFQNDQTAINEVADLYKKNKFLKIDQNLGTKDGSLGYTVKGDNEAMKGFINAAKNTKIYKELHACDSSFELDANDIKSDDKSTDEAKVEVWVSQWSHEITKINVKDETGPDTADLVFEPIFNKTVNVETPKDAVTLSQLQTEIESLVQSLYGGLAAEQEMSLQS